TALPACTTSMSSSSFFSAPATTEIYTLSLHDALPIYRRALASPAPAHGRSADRAPGMHRARAGPGARLGRAARTHRHCERLRRRSEEHTSELQSPCNLVCRLLLEKKKKTK